MLIYLQTIESPAEKSLFETIYLEYRGLMMHEARRYLKDESLAEDAVHQTFLYVAENLFKFKAGVCNKTASYLVKTVRSRSIDILRSRSRIVDMDFYEQFAEGKPDCTGLSPLAECMAKLPERYRTILIMRYHYGFKVKDIARQMAITEGNARGVLARAKTKLEEICRGEGLL